MRYIVILPGLLPGIVCSMAQTRLLAFLLLLAGALILVGLGYDLATLVVIVVVFLLLGPEAIARLMRR